MKNKLKLLITFLLLIAIISCKKEIKKNTGGFSEFIVFNYEGTNYNFFKIIYAIDAVANNSTHYWTAIFTNNDTNIFDTVQIIINYVNLDSIHTPFNVKYPAYGGVHLIYNHCQYGLVHDDSTSFCTVTEINNNIMKGVFHGYLCNYKLIYGIVPPENHDSIFIKNGTFSIRFNKIIANNR